MDTRHSPFGHAIGASPFSSISSVNIFQSWGDSRLGQHHNTATSIQLEFPGPAAMCNLNSKGIKRKWGDYDGSVENPSVVVGLGRPSNSTDSSKKSSGTCFTLSSAKETDEESSMDICLNFDLNLSNENTIKSKRTALDPKPECDLELSLSVGPSESVVTTKTSISSPFQNFLEKPPVLGSITPLQIVDEGSTSSRWKHGNTVLHYLSSTDRANGSLSTQMSNGVLASGAINYSSKLTEMLKEPIPSTYGACQLSRNNNTKTCQFPECSKGARGASGLCIAHGGGRRCQKAGCQKGAEGKTIFCKAHGGGKRCQYLGCTKSAEGRTEYCIAHGGGRRCSQEGCVRAARGKSGLCIRHGGGKRCQKENCTKSAEGLSGLCIAHGGGRRCKYPECTKGAQGSTNFCKAHGGGKRCTYFGCTKGAEGSTPFCKGHGGGKRCTFPGGCSKSVHGGTQFCVAHGGGKRCLMPECTKSARGRTDYCVRHGGGKRCKYEGCSKSAQGSTDFCKAHGGGNRCSWGQPGSNLGAGGSPCDRFARGKIGLCSAHTALVEDHCIHGERTLEPVIGQNATTRRSEKMKEIVDVNMFLHVENERSNVLGWNGFKHEQSMLPVNSLRSSIPSLPEGRVHGGRLLAAFASNSDIDDCSRNLSDGGMSDHPMPYSKNWL